MTPCVLFPGTLDKDGYGQCGRQGKAHRKAYERFVGPIPDGMVVMHLCDNRACINTEHLRLGTQADNMRDRDAKGRQRCGERLSAETLRRVISAIIAGERTVDIAAKEGVSVGYVSALRRGAKRPDLGLLRAA